MSLYPVSIGVLTADLVYIYSNKIKLPDNLEKYLDASLNVRVATGVFAGSTVFVAILTLNRLYGTDPLVSSV